MLTLREECDEEFSPSLVTDLVDRLDGPVIMPLTVNEKSSLAALAQATLEVERSRRSLDICGLRYLISIRMFVNHDRLSSLSGTTTPAPQRGGVDLPKQLRPRPKISFRNIVWATHSESNEVLLQAATESCENGKMLWQDAKRLGVFLWLRSPEAVVSHDSCENCTGRADNRNRNSRSSLVTSSCPPRTETRSRARSSSSRSARSRSSMAYGAKPQATQNRR